MSLSIKALVLTTAALCTVSFAASPPPTWDAPLIYDDFEDVYGDPINRTCLGAVKSYSESGSFTKGKFGYWYTYSGNGGTIMNASGVDEVDGTNIVTAFDADAKCLHVKMDAADDESYAAIASNLFLETDGVDLSKMTALTAKVKGSGTIRFSFKNKYFNSKNYKWGDIGYTVSLPATWTPVTIPVADIIAAEYSPAEVDGVTWEECKTGIISLVIEIAGDPLNDNAKGLTDAWVDDIAFAGMVYSDIVTPLAIAGSPLASRHQNFFTVNNNSISYSVAQPQSVSFSILNLNGSVISQISGSNSPGTHNVALPALSPGNYLVKMNGGKGLTQQVKITK